MNGKRMFQITILINYQNMQKQQTDLTFLREQLFYAWENGKTFSAPSLMQLSFLNKNFFPFSNHNSEMVMVLEIILKVYGIL